MLLLPYQGQNDDSELKIDLLKRLNPLVQNNFNTQIVIKGKKLNLCFKIKDTVSLQHKHNVGYHRECPANNCKDDYVGDTTGCRISERIMDHNGRNISPHFLKHHVGK